MPNPVILPDTPENHLLAENVHPADWINPEPAGRYNLVVIGGELVQSFARFGSNVTLVELTADSGARRCRLSSYPA